MPVYTGQAVIFGLRAIKPIINIPSDALGCEVNMADDELARAYVRFADRIEEWLIAPCGNRLAADTWELFSKQGTNWRLAIGSNGDQGGCVIESGGSAVCVKENQRP